MVSEHHMSERHACALVGLSRDTYRHVGQTSALNVELRESFNGTFRDECLDENWFESLEQARQSIATWRTDYNEIRPHSKTDAGIS